MDGLKFISRNSRRNFIAAHSKRGAEEPARRCGVNFKFNRTSTTEMLYLFNIILTLLILTLF
jgi:hypothetical protein